MLPLSFVYDFDVEELALVLCKHKLPDNDVQKSVENVDALVLIIPNKHFRVIPILFRDNDSKSFTKYLITVRYTATYCF